MDDKNSLLIVDDDTSNLMELLHILQAEYKIYTAKNGASAIKRAEKIIPDLILLDIIMPEMNGFEVLGKLKESEITKDIPIIFITGASDGNSESTGLSLGAVDYIRKPFDHMVVNLRVRHQIQIINLKRHLRHAAQTAEMASRTKSAFLANMSHEIRTPMNAILGITDIMMHKSDLSEDAKENLIKIHSSCDFLLGIINDILDLSKIEAGKMELNPAEYSVASLINDAVHLNVMRIGSKPIEFILNIEECILSKLIGDELRIKQILNNLLSNAFKYTEEGNVTLSIACEYAHELSEIGGKKVMLTISVSDTGFGMTDIQLEQIYDKYSRFTKESHQIVEGTGLGLSITQQLVLQMEGEINVNSKPNSGTVVFVKFPQIAVDGDVLGAENAENLRNFRMNYMANYDRQPVERSPMPYGKVLIVDDVETNLYVASEIMKFYELQIDIAQSGIEAIEKVKEGNEYDIIFMDHMMPGMDGIVTVKFLRDFGYDHPVVALTANAVAGQSEIFMQNGFNGFISKPIDIRQLDIILNKFIHDKYNKED